MSELNTRKIHLIENEEVTTEEVSVAKEISVGKSKGQQVLKKILFPHGFFVFLLFNLTIAGLIFIFVKGWETQPLAAVFYGFSFYTLVVVGVRIPKLVKDVKRTLEINKYTREYMTDKDLRMRVSIYRGLLINFVFATFKIILGFVYNSSWLFAIAGYNVILSLMRFIVVFRAQAKGLSEVEERKRGLVSYKVCGWLMMLLNISVSVIMFMVIVQKQTIKYHMIVTIGLAAFTFYCFIMAIINFIKYRDRKNPVYATIKCIDLVKAIVSIFTLQVTMLTTFAGQGAEVNQGLMNTLTGVAVTIAINTIGALMIASVKKEFQEINANGE